MEQHSLSYKTIGISLIFHLLLLFFLLFVIYSDIPRYFFPKEQLEGESSVIFMPAPPASASTGPLPQQTSSSLSSAVASSVDTTSPSSPEESVEIPEHVEPLVPLQQTPETQPQTKLWSPQQARDKWRKKSPTSPQKPQNTMQEMEQAIQHSFQQTLTQDFSSENYVTPLKQKVQRQFTQDQQERYLLGIAKAILYELNKQHISEIPNKIPPMVTIEVMIDRNGNMHNVRFLQGSQSLHFDDQVIAAIRAAAPFKKAPSSITSEITPFRFSLRSKYSAREQAMNAPLPITFFMD